MARSTKASNAVLRLKERTQQTPYSMVTTGDGRFYLVLSDAEGQQQKVSAALEMDEFVRYVNNLAKLAPKKASKFDLAFEAKIQRATGAPTKNVKTE
jgi:crotonobetainyl-CoA:carnitine CoA-transferase CaiB-like acyl-CoA transferase